MSMTQPHGPDSLFSEVFSYCDNRYLEHWFAYCAWFYPVNTDIRYTFGKSVEVWYRNLFTQFGSASYIRV